MKLLVADRSSAKITTYRGTGKLRSWVQVAAVRNAIELRKRAKPEQPFGDDELVDLGGWERDPELDHIKTLYRGEFVAAFQQALRELGSRDRNVLRMYLMDGLNIDQIGAVYRVHRATVARWIAKSREKLLADTRRLLVQRLQITGTDFESLMAVVRSHLDLSIERFLEASG